MGKKKWAKKTSWGVIEFYSDGIAELLHDPGIKASLKEVADDIAARAGTGYSVDEKSLSGRAVASVFTADADAAKDNLKNNTLLHAAGSVGNIKKTGTNKNRA